MAELVRDQGTQAAERAMQAMDDQMRVLGGRRHHRPPRRQEAIGIEAVHHLDMVAVLDECLRQVLDEARVPAKVRRGIEGGDQAKTQGPHHRRMLSVSNARRRRGMRRRNRYCASLGEKSNGSRRRNRR